MYCFGCSNVGANKSMEIDVMPCILILQLKRFQATDFGYVKNQNMVNVPKNFLVKQVQYDVAAVVNHVGSTMDSGHYTADVNLGTNWKCCNDRRILDIGTRQESTDEAYLVFCIRKIPIEKT